MDWSIVEDLDRFSRAVDGRDVKLGTRARVAYRLQKHLRRRGRNCFQGLKEMKIVKQFIPSFLQTMSTIDER